MYTSSTPMLWRQPQVYGLPTLVGHNIADQGIPQNRTHEIRRPVSAGESRGQREVVGTKEEARTWDEDLQARKRRIYDKI